MWQFLVAIEEELHALDPRLVWLVHEAPANRCGRTRYWVLLRSDICDRLCVGVKFIGYLCWDLVASDSVAT